MSKRCLGCMELFEDAFDICPYCGYVVGSHSEEAIHMEPGTLLYDRYIVGSVLGYGGFGVTYIGWDGKLEQKVAIKEYLPSEFSTRMPGQTHVTVFNGEKNEQFHDGLKKFVEEAKHLAKFQNEQGIVKIFDSFIENDTAYIIMEYLDGETLTSYLKREKTIPEDVAVAMMMPVMESLQVVHEAGLLHRDIAPDNIFLTKTGEVKLIDFGASRYATTSHSRSLTVIIKQGYSPEEQYRSRGDQGPYTDVYALASTMYKMITGQTPPDAMERRAKYENQNKDILEEPHKINKKISINRENAILNAMNVRIDDRTPDIATFIRDLNSEKPVKRIYGKIKKIDIYSWPMWLKVAVPSMLSLVIVFSTLLLTGVIKFSKFTEEIVIPDNIVIVPDVEGMKADEAIDAIKAGQLLVATNGSVESEYIPAGKIILQTPVGASYLDKNGTVALMVSSGKAVESPKDGIATVPYLGWCLKAEAIQRLLNAGLAEPDFVEETHESISAGEVISQSIEAGTQVPVGTKITVTISIGPAWFDMPNVVGQTKDKAEVTLNDRGLVVLVEYKKTDEAPEGTVIAQSIDAGTQTKSKTKITITVASKRDTIDVADVSGKTQEEAEKILKDQGFKVAITESYYADVPAGIVANQNPIAGSAQLPESIVTIWVSLGKKPITVSYDANGGNVDVQSQNTYNSDPYGTLPTPTRTGYTFIGWYSAATDGVKVESTTTIDTPTDHTLYAHWSPITYTVAFNGNGATSGSIANMSMTYDSGKKLTSNAFTKTGYTFKNWNTAANGSGTSYSDNQSISNLLTVNGATVTLYAQWTANTYTVNFNANTGSVSQTSKTVTYDSKYNELPTPSKTGYTFNGWYTATSGGTKITADTVVKTASAQTLYAQWTVNTYTVIFNGNSATSGTMSNQTFTYDIANKLTANAFKRVYSVTYNYNGSGASNTAANATATFNGWATSASGSKVYNDTASVSKLVSTNGGTYNLYANWNLGSVTLPTPTRTGYTFGGWYTAASGGTKVGNGGAAYTPQSSIILYAKWTPNTYTVSFNGNNGTPSSSSKNVTYASTYGTLPSASRTGYTFKGWYTASSGGTQITASSTVTITSGQTLYAQWNVNSYTYNIVYKSSNGTSLGSSTVTYAYGTTNTISASAISGYTTPSAQSVTWDSTSAKTITFTYAPTAVGTQTLKSGAWWWQNKTTTGIKYTVKIDIVNRTADSVTVKITWTNTIIKSFYGYGQYFDMTIGGKSTGKQTIATASKWNQASGENHNESVSKTVEMTITGISATTTSLAYSATPSAQSNGARPSAFSGNISIPTY